MFDGTEDWCKIWRKTGFELSKMTWGIWQIFTGWKNRYILESKLVELNQNEYSKQWDPPDAVWKFYFTLKINEWHN